MPTIYQGICTNCGHKTPYMSSGYGAVFVDHPVAQEQHEVAGAVITSGNRGSMAVDDDPRFVVLAHPLEDSILASAGYRWNDLLWQGRYVWVNNVICRQCGTVFRRRRLVQPGTTGCVTGLGLGLLAGAVAGIGTRSFWAGFAFWYLSTIMSLLACGIAARLYLRWRFPARSASIASEVCCPSCGADDARNIQGAKRVRCPACHTNGLSFMIFGKS